jgi:PKD repeat protein
MATMWDDQATFPYFIPFIWQGDGPNPSPGYSTRGSMYGVGGIPHSQWNGSVSNVGGGGGTLGAYTNIYNNISGENSPAEMTLELNTNSQGQLAFLLDVELTGDISTTNNKIVWVLTHDWEPGQNPDYFASVILYEQSDFELTTTGETGSYEYGFDMAANWDLTKLKAVALIQTYDGDHKIHQASITDFTGLLPMFSTNLTEGPAYLGVQFSDHSFPQAGIDMWEWDFDGDGTFDSTEQNPFHLYTTPGVYDVTLRITVGAETEETTAPGLITVTDGTVSGGLLSGIWLSEFNPYTIADDVVIAENDQLTIGNGVELIFADGARLTVYGELIAESTDRTENPIIMTSNSEWAGIRFVGSTANNLITGCEISKVIGTAISIENGSSVDVIGNMIYDNTSTSLGAAIDVASSDEVLISQNYIANNTSTSLVGGIGAIASMIEISNNVIVNNTGTYGALSLKNGSDALVMNNTFANNLSTNATPYLFFLFNAIPSYVNNIIIDNGDIFFAPFGLPEVTYSCVSGGFTGEGNIDEDPMFMEPSEGDGADYDGLAACWMLQEGSPAIDAGNPDAMYNDPDGSRNDMGAYGGPDALSSPLGAGDDPLTIVSSSLNAYPNPFNPQTSIALNMTATDKLSPVSVGIYNVKGQLVKTLVNNEIVTNTTFVWNGTDNTGNKTSTGMYFVKMKTASTEIGKKILLLK